ncbi:MAG: type I 3-dehydroquinate dehydratase [Chitinispirillia bacterium]|nr:type I 3-dehydroquinate dehydratase [Chitinispirillia bacterium]MCL2268375.1 type I 3-dehydroquinate dehydratase [Chitinispirillia bacterium]
MGGIKIGKLELGAVPRVVGIIDGPMKPAPLERFAGRGVDIFEVRADLFDSSVDGVIDYIRDIRKSIPAPLIGTFRETDSNRANRAAGLVSLAMYVDCVDVELGMPKWREVVDAVPESTLVMVSEHDFNGTPDLAGLDDIVKRSLDQGADIVKIAVMANCPSDVTRLLRFTEDCAAPLVTMAMGDAGAVSRIIAPQFGSLFSYGYLNTPLVPGQLSAEEIIIAMKQYFPARVK